jgi:Pectate lyase superfamily protein
MSIGYSGGALTIGQVQTSVNVLGYGATGNGVTNDATAITAAISAAGVGGTVWFPKGTYIADNLVPLSGQTWAGGGTIKRPTASVISMIANPAPITGFKMIGPLTIDGNTGNTNQVGNGLVFITQGTQCIFSGCNFINSPSLTPMLSLRGGVECQVANNFFLNNGYHLLVGQFITDNTFTTLRNVIVANTFDTSAKDSIFITENYGSIGGAVVGRVVGTVVTGNMMTATGDQHIEVGSGCVGTVVTGNNMLGGATANGAIIVRDAVDTSITGNVARGFTNGAGSYGVSVLNLNGTTSDLRINDNVFRGLGGGIQCQAAGTVDIAITDNTIDGTTAVQGIAVAYATNVSVAGNTVKGSASTGIYLGEFSVVGSGVVDALVSENLVYNGAQHAIGIYENCTRVLIDGNKCYDSQGSQTQDYAVAIQDAAATDITITNNDFTLWGTGALPVNISAAPTRLTLRGNKGYNPLFVTAPAFPATTVVYTNTTGVDLTAYVTNGVGAMTTQINGHTGPAIGVSLTDVPVFIPALGTFTPTYAAGAPTWLFVGN